MTDYQTSSTQHKTLKATTVNINGLSKHSNEIGHHYMLTNGVHISFVTETKKKQKSEIEDFVGYLDIPNNFFSNSYRPRRVLIALDFKIKPSVFNLEIVLQQSYWQFVSFEQTHSRRWD